MKDLRIMDHAGNYVGERMAGGTLTVVGDAGIRVGESMKGGTLMWRATLVAGLAIRCRAAR